MEVGRSPVWKYEGVNFTYANISSLNMGFPMIRAGVIVGIIISRESTGLILRYALPMALMSFMATVMFWADLNERTYDTITILLALAAFSVVVYDNIPQVGYLTIFDYYVAILFYLISVCVLIHIFTAQARSSEAKLLKWPLRQVYVKLSDYVGRCVFTPFVILLYLTMFRRFTSADGSFEIAMTVILLPTYAYTVIYLETQSLQRCYRGVIHQIDKKVGDEQLLSALECLAINAFYYRRLSLDMNTHRTKLRNGQGQGQGQGTVEVDISYSNPMVH